MDKLGDSSAVLSPANRRVHTNPFGSIPPKPYGLPERNDPDLGWFATARRHQFLLFMLAILTFLCTIYLYFAITFGADECSGLRGPQRAACRAARAKSSMGHRRLLSDFSFAAGASEWEHNPLPSISAFVGKLRSTSAGRSIEKSESSSVTSQNLKTLLKGIDMEQGARSFVTQLPLSAATIKNHPSWVSSETSTIVGTDWCTAGYSSSKTYDLVHGYWVLVSQMNRCQIIDILSKVNTSLQPGGYVLLWDRADLIQATEKLAPSLEWTTIAYYTSSKTDQAIVAFQKPEGSTVLHSE